MAAGPGPGVPAVPGLQAEGDKAKDELNNASQNMRQVGNRNFFRRNGQWVDSQVTKKQAANAQRVKQFSDAYFKLAEAHGRRLSQYLVFDEPVLLNLDDQTYLIEPEDEGDNSPVAAGESVLIFEGTVASAEPSPTDQMSTQNYVITVRVDRVVKGRFEGKTFQFRIHSPAMSGLEVGGKCTVERGAAKDGYTVDQNQWMRPK